MLGTGSSQSSCTLPTLGLARMTSPTSSARRRTSSRSGPVTRICTGQPTGGPLNRRSALQRTFGKSCARMSRTRRPDALARLDRLRHQQQLGEVRVPELLVERQKEARRAFADEGRDVGEVGILQQLLFEALGLAFGLREGGAFGQPEVDQDFRAVGSREELLRDEGEAGDAGDQRGEGQSPRPVPRRRTHQATTARMAR